MKKSFIPKPIELNEQEIGKIRKAFPFLTGENIRQIQYWNEKHSPYSGTIISKETHFECYPYDRNVDSLKEEYPGIEIWEQTNEGLSFLELADATWLLDAFVQIREVENEGKFGDEKTPTSFQGCLKYCREKYGVPIEAISDEKFWELWQKIPAKLFLTWLENHHMKPSK